ncbi:MAG: flagellar protein FliT [Comamonas sp.]
MQPLSSMTLRQRYQTLAVHSRRMCDAARAGDWDALSNLGHDYAEAVATLEWLPQAEPEDEEDRLACQLELAAILALDQEIDRLAREQLQAIRTRLGSMRQSRRLLHSYGNFQQPNPTPE